MKSVEVVVVVGARPNFMKAAPLLRELGAYPAVHSTLVHTGQHYDEEMSRVFFQELNLPEPDVDLEVGSGSHAEQTAEIMLRFERLVDEIDPDLVVVVGDVNSTLAGALVAAKRGIPVAHVEAGLRSFDPSMPEEINRRLTDALSDFLFTPSADADENLRREGIDESRIFRTGNVMVDTLLEFRERAEKSPIREKLGLDGEGYAFLTLHRPSNVDDRRTLAGLIGAFAELAREIPVVFPAHPRTAERLRTFGLQDELDAAGVRVLEPLGYLDCLHLMDHARLVVTDSGGIQEETTVLGVPCLTVRESTERPVTVEEGTNQVVGRDPERMLAAARRALDGKGPQGRVPSLWDGKAARRMVEVLADHFGVEARDPDARGS